MIPRKLRVHGLTRFRDPVDLDLDELPPGLVAVCGPNGAGKTSLMEAMGPAALYRSLPSYGGRLLDYCTERDSTVDVTFDHGGSTYRIVHQLDPEHGGGRGKAEAFLYCDGTPLVNGRVRDFDEAIARLFPSSPVFLASAYAAQGGAGNWLGLSAVGRRDLFAELLGLGRLQDLAGRSREHRKQLDAAGGELERRETAWRTDNAQALGLDAEQAREEIALQEAEQLLEAARVTETTMAGAAAAAGAKLGEAQARHDEAAGRRARTEATLVSAQAEHANASADRSVASTTVADKAAIEADAEEHATLTAKRDGLVADWRVAAANAEGARAAHTSATAAAIAARDERGRMLAALSTAAEEATELAEVETQIAAAGDPAGDLVAANAGLESRDLAHKAIVEALEGIGDTALIVRHAEERLSTLMGRANLIDEVPCEGETVTVCGGEIDVDCSKCPLLKDAAEAQGQIGPANTALQTAVADHATAEDLRRDHRSTLQTFWTAQGLVDAAKASCTSLQGLERDRARLQSAIARHEPMRQQLEALGQRVQELSEAQAAAKEATDQTAKAEADLNVAGKETRQALAALSQAPARLESLRTAEARLPDLLARVAAARSRIDEAEETLAAMPLPVVPEELTVEHALAQQARARTAVARSDTQHTVDEARTRLARVHGQRTGLGDLDARRTALAELRTRVGLRRHGWVLLERALGREGIQALEIDAAGPEVSGLVNDLLGACYGGRFRVELRTIREAGGGKKQREVFDLLVHDGEQGGVRVHGKLSGGQKVLVSEALQLALALFNGRREGGSIRTLWRDEADGALDAETALQYPAMLRAAMEIGGYHRVFFTSHRPELVAQADARIVVPKDGRVRIEAES